MANLKEQLNTNKINYNNPIRKKCKDISDNGIATWTENINGNIINYTSPTAQFNCIYDHRGQPTYKHIQFENANITETFGMCKVELKENNGKRTVFRFIKDGYEW